MNMLENPLANLSEKSKIISVGMIPDVVPVVATNDRHTHIENSYVKINLPNEETERKIPNSIPTTKHSYFGPKLNAPVVDFRYYNKKPVYQGTTIPLTTNKTIRRELTVFHGLLFSLIIIVGTILGAFAGYGLYKVFE